jgi:ATP synthase protein I|tara:strand:+ start:596 stop:973 length:378 start_codon:yes stop_codon:yes gene_type:complete
MSTIPKPRILFALMIQLSVLLVLSAFAFWNDSLLGFSVLVGGLNQIVPQAWFSYYAFKHGGANKTHLILRSMYRGETGKILLTASGFVAVFVLFDDLNMLGFMATFIAMIPLQIGLVAKFVNTMR